MKITQGNTCYFPQIKANKLGSEGSTGPHHSAQDERTQLFPAGRDFPLGLLSPARPRTAHSDSLGDAFLGLAVTFEFVVDHGPHGERPSVPTEEGDPAAIQVPKCPLHVVQGPEQVGLVTRDPVQLQVQEGYAWKTPPAPRTPLFLIS